MALQSFLLVPPGSRLLPCKISAPFATVLVPNGQEFENFALNYHFGKAVNPAIAPPTAHQTAKQTAPNDAERRETPHAKFECSFGAVSNLGVIDGVKTGRYFGPSRQAIAPRAGAQRDLKLCMPSSPRLDKPPCRVWEALDADRDHLST